MAPQVFVIGLGHIGLPLACWAALSGFCVQGVDISHSAIEAIRSGRISISETFDGHTLSEVAVSLQRQGRLSVSGSLIRTVDAPAVFMIAVGLAGDGNGPGGRAPLLSALDLVLPALRDGDLVLIRTTLVPGTCSAVISPRLAASARKVHLAYCPETMAESHAFEELAHNPVILAADDDASYEAAERFISSLTHAVVHRSPDTTTAEMAKVVQNVIRDVDIALANEIADAARLLGVNPVELRRLVNSHPRVHMLAPGPGVGGYCLPNALGYLSAAVGGCGNSQVGLTLPAAARALNAARPFKAAFLVQRALGEAGKTIETARVGVLGIGMKDYCADTRLSPALCLISALMDAGAHVTAYDPAVPVSFPFQTGTLGECITGADAVVVTARQDGLELSPSGLAMAMAKPPVVIDTRDCLPDDGLVRIYRL